MSFLLLDQLTGPLADTNANFEKITKNIKYGVKANVEIGVTGEFTHEYSRNGALFTNLLSSFGYLKAHLIDDAPNYSGINVRFMNDDGRIDERAMFDNLKLSSFYRPGQLASITPMIASLSKENHVTVLINLLRVSRILRSDPKGFDFKPNDLFYDDGHLNISYGNFLKRDFGTWNGLSFNGYIHIAHFDDNASVPNDFYCPNLENLTIREFSIFCTLLGEIECDYPLRIAFSTPSLVQTLYLPIYSKHGMTYDTITNITAAEVEIVLRKYIFANRVTSDFDLAYLTVVNSMFAPLPRAAEAHGWISPVGDIYLPKVSSVRGVIPQLTQGVPFDPHPDRALTWAGFASQPKRMMIHAIAATEAFYTGFFEILTASPAGIEQSLEKLGINGFSSATPYVMFCEAASYRFGKPFDLLWETNCGVDCYSHLLATTPMANTIVATVVDNDADGYEVYEVKHQGSRTVHLVSRDLKPALFPILSYGINDDRYFNNSLEYSTSLYYDNVNEVLTTVSSDDANKAMSIFRIGGFNATLVDGASGRAMRNWAANSNGQVVPVLPPGLNGFATYKFPISLLNKRGHCWMDIPNVVDKLTMTAKIKVVGYSIMLNGKPVSNYAPKYHALTVYPKAMSAEKMTVMPMKTDPSALKYRYKGFSLAVSQETTPVVHLQSSLMDTSDLQPDEINQETDGVPEEI